MKAAQENELVVPGVIKTEQQAAKQLPGLCYLLCADPHGHVLVVGSGRLLAGIFLYTQQAPPELVDFKASYLSVSVLSAQPW